MLQTFKSCIFLISFFTQILIKPLFIAYYWVCQIVHNRTIVSENATPTDKTKFLNISFKDAYTLASVWFE
jgi:hypothetical protein